MRLLGAETGENLGDPPESQTPTWTPGMVLHWKPQEPQLLGSVVLSTQDPVQQVSVLAHSLPQIPQLRVRRYQTDCIHHPGLAVAGLLQSWHALSFLSSIQVLVQHMPVLTHASPQVPKLRACRTSDIWCSQLQ